MQTHETPREPQPIPAETNEPARSEVAEPFFARYLEKLPKVKSSLRAGIRA